MIKFKPKMKNLVVFTPKVLKKILCLPSANKPLKVSHANAFLDSQAGSSNILREFMLSSTNMPTNLSTIDITLLQEP